MKAEIAKQHEWLRQLAGEWTFEHDAPAAPGEMPTKFTGTETVRMLGDVWAVCEASGATPDGSQAASIIILGYDPQRQTFTGTVVSSSMNFLWVYASGELDPSGRKLVLYAEGPSFTEPGTMVQYRDTIEIVSADERLLRAHARGDDGTWNEFMVATYRRRT